MPSGSGPVADRSQVERQVVIHKLAEICEARGDPGVVAGRIARLHPSGMASACNAGCRDFQRRGRKHPPNMPDRRDPQPLPRKQFRIGLTSGVRCPWRVQY